MKSIWLVSGWLIIMVLLTPHDAFSFCGFYVAKADTKMFNEASKVVLVRDDNRTVLTMANDYQGDPKEFATVIPVPVVLKRKQINVGSNKVVDHLDSYTAPRLVEYFDDDPCNPIALMEDAAAPAAVMRGGRTSKMKKGLGVKVEATYEVGEYDILILSAKESSGLATWLKQNKYRIPDGAEPILKAYIKRGLKFFVAKVNLKRHAKEGSTFLRPLQIAYESPRFDLPIRLGTVNAKGPQDLFVFALTKTGRVETTNYRTVKIPTGDELPVYVKNEFKPFYKSMFDRLVKKDDMRLVYMEYAWDMNWCDPCAADPLSAKELRQLGVFWVPKAKNDVVPLRGRFLPPSKSGAQNVYVTRLHLRYTAKSFPDDLKLQTTSDRTNFQGRYVLRHPFTGDISCEQGKRYKKNVIKRQTKEAQKLASLTGWDLAEIRKKMDLKAQVKDGDDNWLDNLWK